MKKRLMTLGFLFSLFTARSQPGDTDGIAFSKYPVYIGKDLGLTYSPAKSFFRIWAPSALQVRLLIYNDHSNPNFIDIFPMKKDIQGTWTFTWPGDHKGMFYAFSIYRGQQWLDIVPDPYAKAVAVNGKRAAIIDPKATDPENWSKDMGPVLNKPTDAVIYELHVRDASIAGNSGIRAKGKWAGLTEQGTKTAEGYSTGLDHIRDLGVTHVHLLPVFDFYSIDETEPGSRYNWGYDPLNYNVPEGTYATDPYDPAVRIREFKEMVQAFHRNGLGVIMDVVYNHTARTAESNFNQLVPGYYYRQNKEGGFSNASACGNETASERAMMRKFILESMLYWVKEYHVDGFRIDLMGIHDIETINLISKELHKVRPGILLYGEGWTAGSSPLPDSLRALKTNVARLDRVAVFSDDIRDGIKGSVFDHADRGFVSGKEGMEESVKFGIVAACKHPQVDYAKVNYSKKPYASTPAQVISYAECHDNHVLWDKLALSAPAASPEQRKEMHKLALSIVLSSQGIAFLHAGTEFLRSKKGVENSYESPDSINQIDWGLKALHTDVFQYTKALIRMRREHPAFRMTSAKEIVSNIRFEEQSAPGLIIYTLKGSAVGDSWKIIRVCFNGTDTMRRVSAGQGNWTTFILNNRITGGGQISGELELAPFSCTILFTK